MQFEDLERNWYSGWTFQRTNITEDYDQAAFLGGLPEGAFPVLMTTDKGTLRVIAAERSPKVQPGDRVIWFGCKGEYTQPPAASDVAEEEQPMV